MGVFWYYNERVMIFLLFIALAITLFFIVFVFVFLIYVSSICFGAPFDSTRLKDVERMLRLADPQPNQILYDLGSGDGRIVIEAVKKYNVKSIGIEINPFLVLISRRRIKKLGIEKRAKIYWGNFFRKDLSDADIVTTYLLQITNDFLEKKLLKELKPGAKIISKAFIFKNIPFLRSDSENPNLKLYQIPFKYGI